MTNFSVTFAGSVRTSPNLDTDFSLASLAFDDASASFTLDSANGSALMTAGVISISSGAPSRRTSNRSGNG